MALPILRRDHRPGRNAARSGSAPATRPGRSPWAEFTELHDQMGRLLEEAFGPIGAGGVFGSGWLPAADVEETGDAYVVEVELPGVQREDVSVEFGGGELAVTGEVKERERVGFLRKRTRPVGRFDFRVALPAEVQEEQVTASLTDGVLTVRVPKAEHARQRRIPISS
ncbi:Hsp20/alpha crystallin family protein [Pseudonocardia sp. CA-107938]|uniref:Hsp20/alpha crystallin family protein n=1 Tax=Pseudonocardia sp. CA-107938 TaxID=3240021 RepID=UPI003D8A16CD